MNEIFTVSYGVLWLLVLVMVVCQFAVLRYLGQQLLNAPARKQDQGPETGDLVTSAEMTTITGQRLAIGGQRERPAFIYFASTVCEPCAKGRAALARFSRRYASELDTIMVCRGRTDDDVRQFVADLPSAVAVVADRTSAFGARLRVSHTPYAFVVDRDSVIRGKGSPDGDLAFDWFHQQLQLASGALKPTIALVAER